MDNLINNLDRRICDCEYGSDNTETYREYIYTTLDGFNIIVPDLDSLSNEQLNDCLDYCNNLWMS